MTLQDCIKDWLAARLAMTIERTAVVEVRFEVAGGLEEAEA